MKEEFESFMRLRFPNMWLDFDESNDAYYHDFVNHMWITWRFAKGESR